MEALERMAWLGKSWGRGQDLTGWPGTCYIDQDGLQLTDTHLPVLGLKACATLLSLGRAESFEECL